MPALTPRRTSNAVTNCHRARAIRLGCGRFTNRLTWREIVALYRLSVPAAPEANLPARYNICPTDPIDAVVERDGRRDLVPMRWGLVPSWWKRPLKDFKIATFNARAETVELKAMFRNPFRQKRCLIPASGYYEWQSTPTGKQPYYFSTENGSPLTIAGLWDEWKDIETGVPLKVVHDDHHHRQRLRGQDPRPDAGTADALSV